MYIYPGEYSAKFVIDSRKAPQVTIGSVTVVDSDGAAIVAQARRWGTKLHLDFVISPETPDGVSLIDFVLGDGRRERFRFWVVKP